MNLRHAAALALVGWYLIAVPPHFFKNNEYHEVLLGQRMHKATFDSEFECNRERTKGCHHFENGAEIFLGGPLCWSLCVASDDPRLKSK